MLLAIGARYLVQFAVWHVRLLDVRAGYFLVQAGALSHPERLRRRRHRKAVFVAAIFSLDRREVHSGAPKPKPLHGSAWSVNAPGETGPDYSRR